MNPPQNDKATGLRANGQATHISKESRPSSSSSPPRTAQAARRAWLICSNSNHVKIFAPVARQMLARHWTPAFVSLDNYYGQGAGAALRSLKLERLEVPTRTPDGDWHERTHDQRLEWNGEAEETVREMFEANAPHVVILGNDTGFLEQLFLRTANSLNIPTVLLQDGVLAAVEHPAGSERPVVMGDGGCDLICTWGEGYARRLRSRGVRSRVQATGHPVFDLPVPPRPQREQGAKPTVLLIGQCFGKYGIVSFERERSVYGHLIRSILERDGLRLVFKLHPQHDPQFYRDLHSELGGRFELVETGESLASIQSSDLMVSISSTMGIEAYRLGVPVLTLHYLSNATMPDLELLPGGCRSEEEFFRYLDHPELWDALRVYPAADDGVLSDLLHRLDGRSCERIADAIDGVVGAARTPAAPETAVVSKPAQQAPELSVRPKSAQCPVVKASRDSGWTILREMYQTKKAPDLSGKVRDLELAGVSEETGALLYELVRELRPKQTLETGFAYGFSALFILQALSDNGGGVHEAIDPVERHRWHGIGLANVKRAGFESIFNFLEMPSQVALPSHLINGFKIDFAFIDGSHLFDETLLDAYYVDRMLAPGGVIVIDDWDWMPAVRSVANFIETNLSYEVLPASHAPKVRVLRKIKTAPRAWNHFVPFNVPSTCSAPKSGPFVLRATTPVGNGTSFASPIHS